MPVDSIFARSWPEPNPNVGGASKVKNPVQNPVLTTANNVSGVANPIINQTQNQPQNPLNSHTGQATSVQELTADQVRQIKDKIGECIKEKDQGKLQKEITNYSPAIQNWWRPWSREAFNSALTEERKQRGFARLQANQGTLATLNACKALVENNDQNFLQFINTYNWASFTPEELCTCYHQYNNNQKSINEIQTQMTALTSPHTTKLTGDKTKLAQLEKSLPVEERIQKRREAALKASQTSPEDWLGPSESVLSKLPLDAAQTTDKIIKNKVIALYCENVYRELGIPEKETAMIPNIQVENGVVILNGEVNNASERAHIEKRIRLIRGVKKVHNNLEINPFNIAEHKLIYFKLLKQQKINEETSRINHEIEELTSGKPLKTLKASEKTKLESQIKLIENDEAIKLINQKINKLEQTLKDPNLIMQGEIARIKSEIHNLTSGAHTAANAPPPLLGPDQRKLEHLNAQLTALEIEYDATNLLSTIKDELTAVKDQIIQSDKEILAAKGNPTKLATLEKEKTTYLKKQTELNEEIENLEKKLIYAKTLKELLTKKAQKESEISTYAPTANQAKEDKILEDKIKEKNVQIADFQNYMKGDLILLQHLQL